MEDAQVDALQQSVRYSRAGQSLQTSHCRRTNVRWWRQPTSRQQQQHHRWQPYPYQLPHHQLLLPRHLCPPSQPRTIQLPASSPGTPWYSPLLTFWHVYRPTQGDRQMHGAGVGEPLIPLVRHCSAMLSSRGRSPSGWQAGGAVGQAGGQVGRHATEQHQTRHRGRRWWQRRKGETSRGSVRRRSSFPRDTSLGSPALHMA